MHDIIFLNDENKEDVELRRQIRSRASQHSHSSGTRKPKARNSKPKRASKSKSGALQPGPSLSPRESSSRALSPVDSVSSGGGVEQEEQQEGNAKLIVKASAGRRPSIPRLGSYADEPFDSYPVPKQEWFGEAFDHMDQYMRRGWNSLQTTRAEQEETMLWVKGVMVNEATYFYMNMLSVMGDLVSRGQKDPTLLLWLTGQVVASVNEALGDSKKVLAVGTIFTVGRLALREIVVGDMETGIKHHRPAFARMLVMAGGIDALNLPPIARKHLGWCERMMARKTGIRISQIEPKLANEPTFESAALEEHVRSDTKVLDSYLPYRTRKPGSPPVDPGTGEEPTD